MKEIPLLPAGLGTVALVDDSDYEALVGYTWERSVNGAIRRYKADTGKYRRIFMHRQIMNAPVGVLVDHINMNDYDNQRANLRFATQSQNMQNRNKQVNNKSGYKGVILFRPGLWRAQLRANRKLVLQAYFKTKEDAARAYDKAAIKYHGEFARLNFPNEVYKALRADGKFEAAADIKRRVNLIVEGT